jgi:membrane protein DedA with SNARE-associated domain
VAAVLLFTLAISLAKLSPTTAYLALAGLAGGESMGLPIPGETALITASILANQGKLDLPLVIAIAASASIIGDNLGYLIGRKAGRRLLERPGWLFDHRKRLLDSGERFFDRHGPKAVFLARFFAGVRVTAAWMAGINRMHWRTFLMFNALGAICWATAIGVLGYALGASAEKILRTVGVGGLIVFAVAVIGAAFWWHHRQRHAEDQAEPATESE